MISITLNRNQYAGNDSTTVFPYAFEIAADAELLVYLTDSVSDPEVTTLLTLTTDYTVSGAGDASGGNVTYTGGGTPLPTGWRLTILRDSNQQQLTDFDNQGGYFAESTEEAVDKLTRIVQDHTEILDRTASTIPYYYGTTATITILADPMTTRGDMIIRNPDNTTARLPLGGAGTVLTSDGTDTNWVAFTGGGDMTAAMYDPTTVQGDAFDMDNMIEGADTKILTATERSAIVANTAKVTNATHTGDVTGSTALTIAANVVEDGMLSAGVQAEMAANTAKVTYPSADSTKLAGIEAAADVTDATNVAAAGAVMDTGNEAVAGIKTFSSSPVIPAPTTDLQAATKKYVDDNAGGSPLTTKGDVYGYDTASTRIPVGSNDQVLTADSTQALGVKWAASASGFADPMTTRGDTIVRNASNTTDRLAVGANGTFLSSNGTDIAWSVPSGSGDMVGPASAVDENLVVFDSTTGKLTKDSGTNISAVTANTAKVSNASHTGDVTGSTALTIAADVVTYAKMQNVVADDRILGNIAGAGGVVAELTAANVLTMINVESGAEANNISDVNATDLTDAGDSSLHYHSGDRARANHTGTQAASTISDFDTEVGNNSAVTANTAKVTYPGASASETLTNKTINADNNTLSALPMEIGVACSDEGTDLTTGVAKATFRAPYAFTLTEVRANVNTAPTGSIVTVDINESGTTILSTKITIDAGEKTSETAATAPVISDSSIADDAEITIDIDAVGSSTAGKGLKVWLIGKRA